MSCVHVLVHTYAHMSVSGQVWRGQVMKFAQEAETNLCRTWGTGLGGSGSPGGHICQHKERPSSGLEEASAERG